MENIIKVEKTNPKKKSFFLSKLFFGWMMKLCYTGVRRTLKITDLYECLRSDGSETLGDRLEANWKKELEKAKMKGIDPSLMKVLWKTFSLPYMLIGLGIFFIAGIVRSFQPMILSLFIQQFSSNGGLLNDKLIYGCGLLLMSTVTVFSQHQLNFACARFGMRVRVASCTLIYRKLLRLSKKSLNETAAGQVVNLLSNDVNRFDMVVLFLHFLWIMPIQVVLLTCLIWQHVGISSLAGVLSMLAITLPLQGLIAKFASKLRLKVAQKSDKRIKLMNQLIEGIQVVKMYVWEKALAETVRKVRADEIHSLTNVSYLRGILSSMSVFMERFVNYLTIICYVLLGNELTADVVFALALYYNILQLTAAIYYPLAMILLTETIVSIKRLQAFLLLEEREEGKSTIKFGNDKAVVMENVTASWNPEPPAILNQIALRVPAGTLCAVVGPVGVGKSSLFQLFLGELVPRTGFIKVGGTISYSSQEAWIFASTVRKNILFGQDFDKQRYNEVVDVCALSADFQQLPYGDKTVVGERGISLSGGQKARINLARAVYREADIYLMDDPLSAVDAHVGKHLFEKCILQYLGNKTRILVTHQLQYLKKADHIVVLNNGRIEDQGTFEYLSRSTLDFTKLLSSSEETVNEEETIERKSRRGSIASRKSENWEEQQREKNEEVVVKLKRSAYLEYAKSGGNAFLLFLLFLTFAVAQTSTTGFDYWSSYWTSQEEERRLQASTDGAEEDGLLSTETLMYVYTGLILGSIFLTSLRSIYFYKLAMNASKKLHAKMFGTLLEAPMRFFDTNPIGRILNRFSKDMGIIDEVLPRTMLDAVQILFILIGILTLVTIANYWMIIAAAVLGIAFIVVLRWFVSVARAVKHLEGITRSPVFSHLSATFNGMTSIRASQMQLVVAKEFDQHQDTHTSAWFLSLACISAFGLWLDLVSLAFVYCVTLSFIFMSESGIISDSTVGLAVQQSLVLTGMLSFGMRQLAEIVSNMTAVERVLQYTELQSEEDPKEIKTLLPPPEWLSKGKVVFANVSLKYSDDDGPVLKNLNFIIEDGEKIGIVGRTGAGKSSIIASLFRLAEPIGSISIDGIDIQQIALGELRKRISIIPQEPVLFSETLRYNLDPFNEYDETKLWTALDEVKLKESVPSLDIQVQAGGSNFSVGQRQLICLARALLRRNKILVLDEATANVDPKTDSLIQSTIREKFKQCTVLTIAHRLNTVMDSDKILVMDDGRVAEFGHPHLLLQNTDGMLSRLVAQTGTTMATQLREIARISFYNDFIQEELTKL